MLGSGSPFVRLVCDAAEAGDEGILVLLDGGLEGGQGLEQLGLGAWEFVFWDEPKSRYRYMSYRRVCVRVCMCARACVCVRVRAHE